MLSFKVAIVSVSAFVSFVAACGAKETPAPDLVEKRLAVVTR